MENKIAFVIGTKAELIKCMPLMLELQKEHKDYLFIHTGQHPLGKASEDFGIKRPDLVLSKEPEKSTKFWSKVNQNSLIWFLLMILKIKRKIRKLKPGYVVYHGDTMSSAAAAIGSSRLLNMLGKRWKNVHLEAGLRSGSLKEPFPEEISRRICDGMSDMLLAVSDFSENNLKREKRKGQIMNVGNTIVDSAIIAYERAKKNHKVSKNKGKYVLVNIHRHENLVSEDRMKTIIDMLTSLESEVIWPLHDNTKQFLQRYKLLQRVEDAKNIKLVPLVDYSEFLFLIANCKYLITDGGSIQEESLIFKKSCVILRDRTERQEGLDSGINFLIRFDKEYFNKVVKDIETGKVDMKNFKNPYGERGVSKKILEILK
jgi:UDP-N-acetylglucosamine 2-epimerase (non-hydrolysing)